MNIVGLDIGGANLKAATADGQAATVPFALWQAPGELPARLARLLSSLPAADSFAVTMTGELADCFATKAEGVDRILAAAEQIAGERPVQVWTTAGQFVRPAAARANSLHVAAANWHAQATWVARTMTDGEPAILVDIGSTTTDIIPIHAKEPIACGQTDALRLRSRELVYRGVRRTPLCTLGRTIRIGRLKTPLAAELFATTLDVFLLTGDIPEDPNDRQTANGQPATIAAAHDRMARMVCCDRAEFDRSDAERAARKFKKRFLKELSRALRQVLDSLPETCARAIVSGSGEFLARQLVEDTLDEEIVSLSRRMSPQVAESACAYAVACLAADGP